MKVYQHFRTAAFLALVASLLWNCSRSNPTGFYQKKEMTRAEAKAMMSERQFMVNGSRFSKYLTARHQAVMDRLCALHPEKEIKWRYTATDRLGEHIEGYTPNLLNFYFDELKADDKEDLLEQLFGDASVDTLYINGHLFAIRELEQAMRSGIDNNVNYVHFYEEISDPWSEENQKVYEMNEVDVLPEPAGGLDKFVRAIALDTELPEDVLKSQLPEAVEFEFVVHGGRSITNTNLVTELPEDHPNQDRIYRFFGTLHSDIRGKIASYYVWKKGKKDGKEVNVRMIVSIPTEYM